MKNVFLFAAILFATMSCSSDSDKSEPLKPINDVTINYGQEWFVNEIGDKSVSFENDFIASFKEGKLYGDHVGQTLATTSDGRKFNVTVKSTVTQIKDLEIDWEKDADWYWKNNPFGTMQDNGNYYKTTYTYQDPITKIVYGYTFSPERKLIGAAILVPISYASQLGTYLKERCMPVSTESISDEIFAAGFNAYDYKKATMLFAVSLPNLTAYQVTIINPKDVNSATTRSQTNNISPAIRDLFAKEFLGM
jgi:hypothetical protein